jgi:hypothetical protein
MTIRNCVVEYGKTNITDLTIIKTPKITERHAKKTSTVRVTIRMLSHPDQEKGQHGQHR